MKIRRLRIEAMCEIGWNCSGLEVCRKIFQRMSAFNTKKRTPYFASVTRCALSIL